jgi:hypothetical protein
MTKDINGYDSRSFESGKRDGIRRGYNAAIDKILAEIDKCTELAAENKTATKQHISPLVILSILRDFCVDLDQNLYED